MTESARIADQLGRLWDGDPWYGSNLVTVLEGLDGESAARRPLPPAHTPWELVLHLTAWNREVLRRLESGVAREPREGDWPPVGEVGEEPWRAAVAALGHSLNALRQAIAAFPSERLEERLGEARDRPLGAGVSYYVMLHGIVQHNVAHTAQLGLLKRALTG